MKKNESNLALLNSIFCVCLVVANILASKVISIAGGLIVIPSAVVAYPITFLMTDVIGELWGRDEANKTVRNGLICQILVLLICQLAVMLPVAPFADNQAQFAAIINSTVRVTIASLISYCCSQSWDVYIFHKIRDAYIKKHGTVKGGKWLWNNGSTMTSQIIDTVVFIAIAFYGTVPSLITMMVSQYVVKFIFAALDTPIFYLLTKESK